jgi:hypothetical protein
VVGWLSFTLVIGHSRVAEGEGRGEGDGAICSRGKSTTKKWLVFRSSDFKTTVRSVTTNPNGKKFSCWLSRGRRASLVAGCVHCARVRVRLLRAVLVSTPGVVYSLAKNPGLHALGCRRTHHLNLACDVDCPLGNWGTGSYELVYSCILNRSTLWQHCGWSANQRGWKRTHFASWRIHELVVNNT